MQWKLQVSAYLSLLQEVANFLHTNTELSKVQIGEFLGEADELNLQVIFFVRCVFQ